MKFIELKLKSKTCGLVNVLSIEGEAGMVVAPKRLSLGCIQEVQTQHPQQSVRVQPHETRWKHNLVRNWSETEAETQLSGMCC